MVEDAAVEKRVTWAELFFDLVFVLALVEITQLLGEHHRWSGLGQAFVILVLVYGTWVSASSQANRIGGDTTRERIGLFAVALCSLFMATAVQQVYGEEGLQFALSLWVAQLILYARDVPRTRLKRLDPDSLNALVLGPAVVAGSFLPATSREIVWALVAALQIGALLVMRRLLSGMRYNGPHLRERFGLLVLIALGESLLDIGVPMARETERITVLEGTAMAVSFVLVCGLWWVYFDSTSAAIASALESADVHGRIVRHVVAAHFGVIAAIIMVAVGFQNMLNHPGDELTLTHLNLLYLGAVLFISSLVYMRWAMSRVLRTARVVAVLLILALLPLALMVPGIVATAGLAVILVTVVELEKKWPMAMSRGRLPVA